MSKQCKCGKGYVSQWDDKCGKCRTKKEQRDHQIALRDLDLYIAGRPEFNMTPQEAYKGLRKLYK
ncbi:gp22 [Shigella virus Moo19]|uniref:Uncharacterized protein n=1 Tax=Shigella virus Moo19 TaxID=2886042 RepID=A0AAE9C4Z4_9CAUD|nr:gp22 [Shigella virus Moo19]UEN68818.1 hypothetical protein Moo19_gp22 [Shigella virus Moo19]